MRPRQICNSFDITHQAHIRGGWKIWILCHMCSYQKNIMIFAFLKTIKLCHTMRPLALSFLEWNKKPIKFIFDFSKFQNSPILLDFTYKLWILREKVMLCFYANFDTLSVCLDFRHEKRFKRTVTAQQSPVGVQR